MDCLEFIARVTSHIPDKGQVMVRYYGLYAKAHRGNALSGAFYEFLTTTRGRRDHHFVMGGISSEPKGRGLHAARKRKFLSAEVFRDDLGDVLDLDVLASLILEPVFEHCQAEGAGCRR